MNSMSLLKCQDRSRLVSVTCVSVRVTRGTVVIPVCVEASEEPQLQEPVR